MVRLNLKGRYLLLANLVMISSMFSDGQRWFFFNLGS